MPVTRHAKIAINVRPTVQAPQVSGANMSFNCSNISAVGSAEIVSLETPTPAGWQLGWMQAEWCETNWAYYRGQTNNDGCSFLQRGRAPARTSRACRDSIAPGAAIYNTVTPGHSVQLTAASVLPAVFTANHYDKPSEFFPLQRANTLTGRPNMLREAQLEFMFCAVLVLISPTGAIHQLSHFYWNVRWQGRFLPSNFANLAAAWTINVNGGGQGAAVSMVFGGASHDHRFSNIMVAGAAPNCNVVAGNASNNPNVQEARIWQNFDVTR